jgi:hypothetical protein
MKRRALPLLLASRLRARWTRPAGTGVEAEWRAGGLASTALRAVLSAEVRLTAAGLRFPVGGSRVVVGRKP